ncbi:glycosyltransferase [Undibacterium sp.]|uniref:glycosyltransferase n=1 Tax=Undibacterium sp. TaxID=1914977 RepID=UPI00375315F0
MTSKPIVSVVVIGRNEGARLNRCLTSIQESDMAAGSLELIYVDSASTDDSLYQASTFDAQTILISDGKPCAARGRNAGWQAATAPFVLFLDGDTILHPEFIKTALDTMRTESGVAVVWGHRREIAPEQSIYVRVLDLDWMYPPGDSEFCGGDALFRRSVLVRTGGFNDTLIAGEEPELCNRLRELGYKISHIDAAMTQHDLAITSFPPYWKRAFRAGYAYAQIAEQCRYMTHPLWSKEVKHHFVRGSLLAIAPILLIALSLTVPIALAFFALLAMFVLARTMHQCKWKSPHFWTRFSYAVHSHFQHLPIVLGQIDFYRHQFLGRERGLIEYKQEQTK